MTMVECIEQRKATLSGVVESALERAVHEAGEDAADWGITIEVAQVAQVFIVDAQLRQQLEAEVRNEIKLKSDQSSIRTQEETRLTEMASDERVQEQQLATDQENLRREEALEHGLGRGHSQLREHATRRIERDGGMRRLVGIDPDRDHARPPRLTGRGSPRRAT
jgi:light-regulated signal transduction histidine kinase (bacteriophytochrome)